MRTCTGMIIIKVRFVFLWVFFWCVWIIRFGGDRVPMKRVGRGGDQ